MHRIRVSCSRQQFALPQRCVTCLNQKRWATGLANSETEFKGERVSEPRNIFIRHKEPSGQIWYTLKSRAERIGRPKNTKYFEMPNVVLDLDAYGQNGVREFNAEDEDKMSERWSINRKHQAKEAVVKTLEAEVARSRQSWHDILAEPASPWRINPHDLMSVALRGAAPEPDHMQSHRIGPGGDPDLLQFLCHRNGIPAYAAGSDQSALEWMLIRQAAMEQHIITQPDQSQVPSLQHFTEAIEKAQSFLELRRVISTCSFGSLGNEHGAMTSFGHDGSVSRAVQSAIARLIGYAEPDNSSTQLEEAKREAMAIVGNTELSLRSLLPTEGARLWGFGLHMATKHSLAASIEYIRRGLEAGYAEALQESRTEIVDAILRLPSLLESYTALERGGAYRQADGEALLALLTGVGGVQEAGYPSARSFILKAESYGIDPNTRLRMYVSYIDLLGKLGAVRTLWSEHQTLSEVASYLKGAQIGGKSGEAYITNAILRASIGAPAIESEQEPLTRRNSTMAACALGDYKDMAAVVQSSGEVPSASSGDVDTLKLEQALHGSLQTWLKQLGRYHD